MQLRKMLMFCWVLLAGIIIIGLTRSNSHLESLSFKRNPHNLQEEDTLRRLSDEMNEIKELLLSNQGNMQVRSTKTDRQRIKALIDELDALKKELLRKTQGELKEHTRALVNESIYERNDNKTAEHLRQSIRVLCYIPIADESVHDTAPHVLNTWGKHCNKLVFFANHPAEGFPVVGLGVEDSGSYDLAHKMYEAYHYLYQHYLEEYDWYIKADTDTYIIAENLRYMLSDYEPKEALYFGHEFVYPMGRRNVSYVSGGGGYVMSREALRRFGEDGYGKKCEPRSGTEDWEFSMCMTFLRVKQGDARDKLGRSRFHCFPPSDFIHGHFPKWFYEFDKFGARKGMEHISDYAISFHFLEPEELYMLEFYIYHLRPYGLLAGLADLNPDRSYVTPRPQSQAMDTRAPTIEEIEASLKNESNHLNQYIRTDMDKSTTMIPPLKRRREVEGKVGQLGGGEKRNDGVNVGQNVGGNGGVKLEGNVGGNSGVKVVGQLEGNVGGNGGVKVGQLGGNAGGNGGVKVEQVGGNAGGNGGVKVEQVGENVVGNVGVKVGELGGNVGGNGGVKVGQLGENIGGNDGVKVGQLGENVGGNGGVKKGQLGETDLNNP